MLFTRHVVKFFYGDKLVVDGQSTPYAIFYKGNGLILTENDLIKYGLGKQIIPAYAQKTQFVVLPIPIGYGAVFTTTNPICTTYNDFTVDKR